MAEKRPIYQIEDLYCQYKSNKYPVLQIKDLQIEDAQVYFFVGSSGVGKSTILETLGLMNNTIKSNGNTKFIFNSEDGNVDFTTIWNKGDQKLAEFRKNHLSFIFQSTNLFNYLSAYQNAAISQILQGKKIEEANLRSRQLLLKLFNQDFVKEIVNGKSVLEMSGGQKQRLAFARALGTSYSVLLADEPTGNLDHHNARNLIEQLVQQVHSTRKTAIIVSHDIDLSVDYGDQIVLIRRETFEESGQTMTQGKVDKHSIYKSKDGIWSAPNGSEISSDALKSLLKASIQDI